MKTTLHGFTLLLTLMLSARAQVNIGSNGTNRLRSTKDRDTLCP